VSFLIMCNWIMFICNYVFCTYFDLHYIITLDLCLNCFSNL